MAHSLSPPWSPPPDPPPSTPPPPPPLDLDQVKSEHGSEEDLPLREDFPVAHLPKLRNTGRFIEAVEIVTLASQFDPEQLEEFLWPQEHKSIPPNDPALRLSLLNYIPLLGSSSQDAYEAVRKNTRRRYNNIKILSHYQVERRAQKLSGLLTWEHRMCFNELGNAIHRRREILRKSQASDQTDGFTSGSWSASHPINATRYETSFPGASFQAQKPLGTSTPSSFPA